MMQEVQFQALAATMRLHKNSGSSRALRAVLVEGATLRDAAGANLIQVNHIEALLESARLAVERAQLLHGAVIPRL